MYVLSCGYSSARWNSCGYVYGRSVRTRDTLRSFYTIENNPLKRHSRMPLKLPSFRSQAVKPRVKRTCVETKGATEALFHLYRVRRGIVRTDRFSRYATRRGKTRRGKTRRGWQSCKTRGRASNA